jgi:hypothetical chaperone protein
MPSRPTVFAIDFGTSNSLLAGAAPGCTFPPAPLDPDATDPTVLRSALYFASVRECAFGVAAIRALVANGFRGRLIRSIKRHLASRAFTATRIAEKTLTIEELIASLLRAMRERAERHYQTEVARAVLGRPARFSNDDGEDALAEQRLRRAAELAGFREVSFCPEPVAAAYDFAGDLSEPRLVLIVDLGGGTSDFTLVRMDAAGFRPSDVLSVGGVAVAGDALDGALVRCAVAPELGSKARFRVPFGSNVLEMPMDLVELLCSPADLTLVDRAAIMRRLGDIQNGLLDPRDRDKLEKYRVIVEDGVGFDLYEAVEGAKRRLSDAEESELSLEYPGAELVRKVEQKEFHTAAERPIGRIFEALDRTLATGGVRHDQVDIVCLTGGTSRMPLIELEVQRRLPRAALRRLTSFHSVVQGLARHAAQLA